MDVCYNYRMGLCNTQFTMPLGMYATYMALWLCMYLVCMQSMYMYMFGDTINILTWHQFLYLDVPVFLLQSRPGHYKHSSVPSLCKHFP